MSGYQLGLLLFGTLLTGFGLGIVAVWAYARHVLRSKLGPLASALAGPPGPILTTTYYPPPEEPTE